MRLPIRWRVSAVYGAVFLLLVLLLSAATYASALQAVDSIVDRELATRLDGLDDHITRHLPRFGWAALADSLRAHSAFDPALLSIADEHGNRLFAGAMLQSVPMLRFSPRPAQQTLKLSGRRTRLLFVQKTYEGRPYDLILGADLGLAAAVLDRLWTALILLVPTSMLVACWAGYVISGRALAPVSAIISSARAIDASRLGERIRVEQSGDEVEQLAVTFNRMLDRIEEGFLRIRQFTADASHELRTPVAIIRTAAEVALVSPKNDVQSHREALRRILSEAEQSSTMLEDLLFLARADSQKERRRNESIDLGLQLRLVSNQMRPLADARRVKVHVAQPGDAVLVEGDGAQLRRLWVILLDNALAHTAPEGHVFVTTGGKGRTGFCEVRDTGCDIAPEHLPRIFERFYRADKARTRNGASAGSGLGLAIAARIVASHGGAIEVSSTVGSGTTFRVTFPLTVDVRVAATA